VELVGYWKREGFEHLPDPRSYVDAAWDESEKRAVLKHLSGGRIQKPHLRSQICTMCGGAFGADDMTDGTWSWQEDLTHYIVTHFVRPDQRFIRWTLGRLLEARLSEKKSKP
jgi:hypothetical protein